MVSSRTTGLFGALFLSLAMVACGGGPIVPGADAGTDVTDPDGGSDVTDPDGGSAAPDAGTDPDGGPVDEDTTPPTVTATNPAAGAVDVPINVVVSATFSEELNPLTLDGSTFTLAQGATNVPGVVTYLASTARFDPDADLVPDMPYTATVTTGVQDLAGNELAQNFVWSFTTGPTVARGPAPVGLGAAGNYVVLAKTAISTVPASVVTGHIGISPAAASFITGFSLVADSTNVFSTATQVTGQVFAADYAPPTPSNLTTAVSNMEAAYTDAASRVTPDFLELGTGNLGGRTLAPGLYKFTSSVIMPDGVIIEGGANDVWIFQTTGDLSMDANKRITLAGGAKARNIFWQVAGQATFGAGSHFEGILLSKTAITLQTGATMNGRALAQTEVALQQATITRPE